MKDSRTIAAIATALVAVLLFAMLFVWHISLSAASWPPPEHPSTELVEIEEEYVDFFDPMPVRANPSPAYKAEKSVNASKSAPSAGADLTDAGKPAMPAPDVTSERPSPIAKPKKDKPEKTGPDREAMEREEARRKALSGVSNAFKASEESSDNTTSKGRQQGDSGTPEGASSDVNGSGSGTVGGGWIMPRYSKVDSRQTGSIILRAVVNSLGKVTSVELVGGKAPASANPTLVEKCKAEIRRHTFTRNDDDAPERSIATITYTFR